MQTSYRNNTLDILRLVASFFIIFLHITYGNADKTLIGIVRLSARWAMPFFFLLSGYLFQKGLERSSKSIFKKKFGKIFNIFLVTNIVYIPLNYFLHFRLFDWSYLFYGDFLHLWFLPALLIGFTVIYLIKTLRVKTYISICITLFVIAAALLGWSYSYIINVKPTNFLLLRSLLAVPFMLIGTYFYNIDWFKRLLTLRAGITLMTIGFILQFIEVYVIKSFANITVLYHQFLIGTSFFSMGIFILGLTLNLKNETVGKWGKDYSLFIYLYHPMLIYIFQYKNHTSFLTGNYILLFPVIVFLLTLSTAICLDKYLHPVFGILNGSLKRQGSDQ